MRRRALGAAMIFLVAGCAARDDLPDPEPAARARAAAAAVERVVPSIPPAAARLDQLSRDDCLRLALADNRSYRVRRSSLGRADEGRIIAHSQVYTPTLNASYTIANRDSDQGTGRIALTTPIAGFVVEPFVNVDYLSEASAVIGAGTYQSESGITVSRRLFGIAQHRAQRLPITTAETAYLSAANDLVIERKRVELEVVRRFFAVQRAQARERVRDRRVTDARDFLQAVRENVHLGFKAPVESLQAEISLNQAEADLLDERTAVREAKEALLALLAQPVAAEVGIVEEDVSGSIAAPPPLADDARRLLDDNEELGNRLLDLRLRLEQLAIERDEVWPDLTASLTGERRRTGNAPFDGSTEDANVVALTLTYRMPLDFERSARARVRQLVAEVHELELQLADAKADLENRLRSSHRRIVQLGLQVDLAVRRLAAERGRMAVTLARYQAGTIDNLEVTRGKQDVDNAEINLADARTNLVIAQAEYRDLLPAPLHPLGDEAISGGDPGPRAGAAPAVPADAGAP